MAREGAALAIRQLGLFKLRHAAVPAGVDCEAWQAKAIGQFADDLAHAMDAVELAVGPQDHRHAATRQARQHGLSIGIEQIARGRIGQPVKNDGARFCNEGFGSDPGRRRRDSQATSHWPPMMFSGLCSHSKAMTAAGGRLGVSSLYGFPGEAIDGLPVNGGFRGVAHRTIADRLKQLRDAMAGAR